MHDNSNTKHGSVFEPIQTDHQRWKWRTDFGICPRSLIRFSMQLAGKEFYSTYRKCISCFDWSNFSLGSEGYFGDCPRLLYPQKLESMFGRNTIFAINPWHPRHIASIAALAFMAPTIVRSVGILAGRVKPEKTDRLARTLTWGVLFSFVFNRVVLHSVNQFAGGMS